MSMLNSDTGTDKDMDKDMDMDMDTDMEMDMNIEIGMVPQYDNLRVHHQLCKLTC
jgi:hypothetical protein